MTDFYAIDFETANHLRGSPCAVGIVEVSNGEIASVECLLMRPGEGMLIAYGIDPDNPEWEYGEDDDGNEVCIEITPDQYFDPWNIELHDIRWSDVADKPTFMDQYAQMRDIIGDAPVVAHNASFDVGVVRDACDAEGIVWPSWSYFCTLTVGRNLLGPLEAYTLPYCLDAARRLVEPHGKHKLFDHHDPVADAEAAAELALLYMKIAAANDLNDLLDRQRYRWGKTSPEGIWNGCTKKRDGSTSIMHCPTARADANPHNDFYGLNVCLTGALPYNVTRKAAWNALAKIGAQPQKSVTKTTDLLIVGDLNPRTLRPGTLRSRKQVKATSYGVEFITGKDFLDALVDAHPSGWQDIMPRHLIR